jgi:uncharacterized SAM-dependent methyltransferase
MEKMMREETSDIVIKLHDIARELEKGKYWLFGKDLRDLADRLARVSKHYDLTAEEQFAYNYIRAVNGMEINDV